MQLKPMISAVCLAMAVSACSSVDKIVYRIDVPQGNYLQSYEVEQLRVGMNAEQVQYLLGTPVLTDPFSATTWYYVYLEQRGYQKPDQHTLTVHFDNNRTVTSFHLDRPLPDSDQVFENNTIIDAQPAKSPWWKFW
ncbi:outer membrane protein assembly factor BamE [Volucribacter amazonae]|uniref:Outer membrane protein assembly factor BamE n=1 Tax=Volucribacter amazonae TaxID=256731 RepID=A0A9X4SIR8_9PAST|nr:outer membrane protein assembly factor BamE [Volucribacter amazonae]MDG6895932.1 cell envelope protein SmpA [Volucribacter amazonae]